MKWMLACAVLVFSQSAFSQTAPAATDIVYGSAKDWKGQDQNLTLDVYSHNASASYPLVVYLHGGGFMNGNKNAHTDFCQSLSEKGYAVANVNYRLGFDTSAAQRDAGLLMAVYRAEQDAATALQYLKEHAQEYHIDTSAIFLAGESAGAVTSLGDVYMTQQQWDALFPALRQVLGPITETKTVADAFHIRGVISLWGGMIDTTLITPVISNSIPVMLVQSRSDEVIPFEHGKGERAAFSTLFGSYDIAKRFQSNGACSRLYFTKDAPHFFGFSHHFVVGAIQSFVDDVLNGRCSTLVQEDIGERNDVPFSSYK